MLRPGLTAEYGPAKRSQIQQLSGHTSDQRRPGRIPSILTVLPVGMLAVMAAWFLAGFVWGERKAEWRGIEGRAAIHTISADCVSAQQMAERYGWAGDWREYMEMTRRLNGWEQWPYLHAGEEIVVPEYRGGQR